MEQKNTALVLLSPLNSLLLVFGITIIIWTTAVNICPTHYCYALEQFTTFYQTIFFTYGLLLTVISIFGFIAMMADNQGMLNGFGKMLMVLLLLVFIILWLGLWGTGPMHLRAVMLHAFKSYGTGNCRLDRAIDDIQMQFHCCGIERPDDWNHLQALQIKNVSLEPLSCCNMKLMHRTNDGLKCISTYQNGCYVPLRRHIWRMVSVVTAIGFTIAFIITLTILPLFRLIKYFENRRNLQSQETLDAYINKEVQALTTPLTLYRDGSDKTVSGTSTVV